MSNDLVVVLTALNLEYQAVRDRLRSPEPYRHPRGTRFEIGTLPGGHGRVVLGLTGKGNQSSAVLAERAIQEFSPAALLFVGVAGALWDTPPFGDVVVATHVYAYHGGTSEDDGLKARPRVWEAAHEISQIAAHLARVGTWAPPGSAPGRPRPQAHLGAIAAGEVVQNSRISREADWIRQTYNDAVAIEMEGAGVAQAGHLSGSPVAIVRGISDRADGTKATEADRKWQPIAAANAAAFALELATELTEAEPPTMREDSVSGAPGSVNNTAHGSVGVQAGHVSGGTFHVSLTSSEPEPVEISERISALREELAQERSSGRIDEETHEAASTELDIASKGIEEATPQGRKTSLLALKRLMGLLGDLASLATKVASLITSVKGLT